MKKLAITPVGRMLAGSCVARVKYGNSVHWTETAVDTNGLIEWTIPGWVGENPPPPADRGISPTYEQDTTGLTYVYPKLSDSNSGLDDYLELTDDLIYGTWTNQGYTVTGTGPIDSEFDAVTNQIPADTKDEQFVRLIIEEQ